MRTRADTVIIGAGIVGVSTAYELAKRGRKKIVVIDRGTLYRCGGSTSHAPGGILQNNNSRTVSKLAQWSVDLFCEISEETAEPCYYASGSVEVATTDARLTDLRRKHGLAQSWGLESSLLTPDEVRGHLPLLDTDLILGGIHVERDGILRAVPFVEGVAARASALGVELVGETSALSVDRTGGRVRAVETSRGRIECDEVVICAGIWGPLAGRLAGIPIPLQPCAHPIVRSTPLAEIAGTRGVERPIWRHQDHSMYLVEDDGKYVVGNYRHAPMLVDPEQIDDSTPAPADVPWREELMAPGWAEAQRLVPALRDAGRTVELLGMFSFTPDAQSLLGESVETRGLWVAEAVWATHAAGVGRALAELMTTGDCELDLRELDVNRFADYARSRPFVRARGERQYVEIYDAVHPLQPYDHPRGLRRTPFYDRQRELGAFFQPSAAWERPAWFEANAALERSPLAVREGWAARYWSPIASGEHLATRSHAGLFDMSTFQKIEVSGAGALAVLQRLACSDLDRPVGRIAYTCFLNGNGGIESDLTILRQAEDRFLLFGGSGSGPRDLAWVLRAARDTAGVTVRDVTSGTCGVGLWGPRARAILEPLTEQSLDNEAFPYFSARSFHVGAVPVTALRLSYVGEYGWELHTPSEYGGALWDLLLESGEAHGLVACGTVAMDSLRLEKGYRGLGTDLLADHTPAESGLGFAVAAGKAGFIGERAAREAPRSQLCALAFDDATVSVLGKEPILSDGRAVGYVTSANTGYTVGASLALGYLPLELASEGTRLEVEWFGERHGAAVVREPLYDPEHERMRARA